MLGHTGAGKSSTGNSILGEELFDSYTGVTSQTRDIRRFKVKNFCIDGKDVYLADTPGFFDTRRELDVERDILEDLRKFSPHVYLLVISLRDRFPKGVEDTLDRIELIFGEGIYK